MIVKKGAIHENKLAVAVTILRSDVESKLKDYNGDKILYDGTPMKAKDSKDFRKDGVKGLVAESTETMQGVLSDAVIFKVGETQKVVSVMLEGVVYGDMIENFDKSKLPATITYIYKNRK